MDGDRIEIRGLRLLGTHGVLPEERARPQPFEIDLDLWVSMDEAGASDQLAHTVDYATVVDRVSRVVQGPHSWSLLEAMASAIASAVLDVPRVESVSVSLRKLQPPLPADVVSVGVRLTRAR